MDSRKRHASSPIEEEDLSSLTDSSSSPAIDSSSSSSDSEFFMSSDDDSYTSDGDPEHSTPVATSGPFVASVLDATLASCTQHLLMTKPLVQRLRLLHVVDGGFVTCLGNRMIITDSSLIFTNSSATWSAPLNDASLMDTFCTALPRRLLERLRPTTCARDVLTILFGFYMFDATTQKLDPGRISHLRTKLKDPSAVALFELWLPPPKSSPVVNGTDEEVK